MRANKRVESAYFVFFFLEALVEDSCGFVKFENEEVGPGEAN